MDIIESLKDTASFSGIPEAGDSETLVLNISCKFAFKPFLSIYVKPEPMSNYMTSVIYLHTVMATANRITQYSIIRFKIVSCKIKMYWLITIHFH